jgi:hypothetical protein
MKKVINYLRENKDDILGAIAVISATSATLWIVSVFN